MAEDIIIVRKENSVCYVQINQPETLNALNSTILKALDETFNDIYADTEIRVVVLTGTDRSFVAGANIKEMAGMDYEQAKVFGKFGASVFRKIEQRCRGETCHHDQYRTGRQCRRKKCGTKIAAAIFLFVNDVECCDHCARRTRRSVD